MLKRNMLALFAIAIALSASADGRKYYYLTTANNANLNEASKWSDPSTGNTLGTFDAGGDYWIVKNGRIRTMANNASKTFNGAELNIGSPSQKPADWNDTWGDWWGNTTGRLFSYSYGSGTYGPLTIGNLVWWNGELYVPSEYSGHFFKFCGTYTIRQADSDVVHQSYMQGSNPYVEFNATIQSSNDEAGAADAVWTIQNGTTLISSLENLDEGTNFVWRMTGDHSAYKGRINVTAAYQPLVVYNGTIIGDPSVSDPAAITLGNNAAIAFAEDFAQGSARGIQLSGNQAYLATWESLANEYTVSYPISKADGAAGALIKRGPGTVTLNGDYSAGPITVHSGTLVIGLGASVPSGTAICVEAGARLESYLPLSLFAITGEGTVERKTVTLTVPFDPEASGAKTVPVEIAAVDAECEQPLRLSMPIPLPLHDGLKVPVARYVGSGTVSAADFVDVTEKTSGLPVTHLSVENENDVQVVYLTADPVVVSVKDFEKNPVDSSKYLTFNGIDDQLYWSDSLAAHADADYLFTNKITRFSNDDFNGHSLVTGVMKNETQLGVRISTCKLPGVIIYPKTRLYQELGASQTMSFTIGGSAALAGDYGDDYSLNLQNAYDKGNGPMNLAAVLTGSGTLLVDQIGSKSIDPEKGDIEPIITLSGDNSAFAGKIISRGNGWINLAFNEQSNLGGALPEFHEDALDIGSKVWLRPLQTTTLANDVNRGIKVSSEAGFYVTNGVTFTSLRPLLLEADLQMAGAGELRLGGALSLGTAETRSLYVRGGGNVCALNDDAVAGLCLVSSNDFTVVAVPGLECGFGGLSFDGVSRPKVHVRFDVESAEGAKKCETVICTVDDSAGIDVGDFVVESVQHYSCSLEKVPAGGNRSKFVLKCWQGGLTIVVR